MRSGKATGQGRDLAPLFRRVGGALASSLDLHDLLALLVDEALALLTAEVSLLRLLDRPGENLELQVARGVPEEVVRQVRFRPGEGLAGRLLLDGIAVRGLNLQQDPRATQRALARRYGWRSFVAVALHLHQQPIGVWFLIRKQRKPFSDEDVALLSSLADYASLAVERSWLLNTIVREKHESEAVIQASANGILVVDGHGRVVDMNPALERLTGWTLREARGQPCCDVVGCQGTGSTEVRHAPGCPLKMDTQGCTRAFVEYRIETREGRSIPVEASYGLIYDDEGELARLVIVFHDVSHQEELNRLRAEIVANVSHELRTPLALIKGYATTLLSPQVDLEEAEARRFLFNVSIAADRLSRMIDDLLCASRIETQQLELRPAGFDLGQTVRQVLDWFQPHVGERQLVADLPADSLQLWADPDRVEQVLVNLLSNAAKYSPAESAITVQARLRGDPGRVVVHVNDEGIGIAPEHLPRIFDRFYLTEDSQKGVGLGLYICKELVEAMGGEIWAVSELGVGSTFSFALPLAAEAAPAVASALD